MASCTFANGVLHVELETRGNTDEADGLNNMDQEDLERMATKTHFTTADIIISPGVKNHGIVLPSFMR